MATASTNVTPKPTKVITGECRASYVHVFEPYAANENQEPKYSLALLIPKSDKATFRALRKAQKAALEDGRERVFKGKPPRWSEDELFTIHDGDEEADLDQNPEYAGHWYVNVSAKTKPGVVDRQLNEIIDSTEIYSGCYVRASLNAFAYYTSGNKGVSFGLNHLQKLRDGAYLGGRSRAEDDFDELDDEYDDDDDVI